MPAYDNTAVAAKLELYSDLLEISGADKYRLLAYRRAANSIRAWPEQVAVLANEGRLTDVPGVGAKMAGTVEEIVRTGTFPALSEVSETYPPSLAQLKAIPGVGPKRAAMLHERLGISTIDELDDALLDGRVARLGGFGPKTAEKIALSLESRRRHLARTTIEDALPVAEQLEREIIALPGVAAASIAGSVRRRAETVANIDFVVAASNRQDVFGEIARLPSVERVLETEGTDHLAIELHSGLRVDVYGCEPAGYGTALQMRTGSAEHNAALALRAANLGIVLPLGHQASEASLYAALGLPELPPEAREAGDLDEIASRADNLVTLADVRGDLQSHSTFTDGKNTLEANREMAHEIGYEYLAATDHAYALRMVGGLDVADLERQWAEIDEINGRDDGGPRILKGIELNIAENGSLDYDDEVLARFDIILASLHSGWDQEPAQVTKRVLAAIEHPLVDIIAHPTGRVLGRRDPLKIDVRAMLEAAGENGTIMEINSYPDRLDLSDVHIKLARSFGVRFSLGTDAHAAEHMRFMRYGVAQARRGLVSRGELLNAQPWEVARTWLKRHRILG